MIRGGPGPGRPPVRYYDRPIYKRDTGGCQQGCRGRREQGGPANRRRPRLLQVDPRKTSPPGARPGRAAGRGAVRGVPPNTPTQPAPQQHRLPHRRDIARYRREGINPGDFSLRPAAILNLNARLGVKEGSKSAHTIYVIADDIIRCAILNRRHPKSLVAIDREVGARRRREGRSIGGARRDEQLGRRGPISAKWRARLIRNSQSTDPPPREIPRRYRTPTPPEVGPAARGPLIYIQGGGRNNSGTWRDMGEGELHLPPFRGPPMLLGWARDSARVFRGETPPRQTMRRACGRTSL